MTSWLTLAVVAVVLYVLCTFTSDVSTTGVSFPPPPAPTQPPPSYPDSTAAIAAIHAHVDGQFGTAPSSVVFSPPRLAFAPPPRMANAFGMRPATIFNA
jgi:hypothetical protein